MLKESMENHSDLTFITNEEGRTLLNRFNDLVTSTRFFDVLVGYFYVSGFHLIYKSLERVEKMRILIGIGTDKQVQRAVEEARQQRINFSHKEVNDHCTERLKEEMAHSEDTKDVEDGAKTFLNWLCSKKLEIKAYPTKDIHAKLYIMSFHKEDRDKGRVITGSSNFTSAGLQEHLEFNVELKAASDHDFAQQKFEELWRNAVDLSETYAQTIQKETWLSDTITPYELYLKCLYTYFREELSQKEAENISVLGGAKRLRYQIEAVLSAKKILEAYGGVFISDVVGLGKTYISAMLADQLDGGKLVIAPPALLDKSSPGSWKNVFHDFNVSAHFESLGKLDQVESRSERYDYVFIDEAHRFRTESNTTYETLAKICRGKKVILVTATPYNNSPKDILSLIKLFQSSKKSTIPNVADLEAFFGNLSKKLKKLDKQKDRDKYMQVVKENARRIRGSVLKYLMIRRTRREIEQYFSDDIKSQGIKFPEVEAPEIAYYKLSREESEIFDKTVKLIAKEFKYARYMPMLYYKGDDKPPEQFQRNMGRFMKILLVKRLESSFFAFRKTVERFISHYRQFLGALEKGTVYTSKDYSQKIFELLDRDDDKAIQKLLEEDKANAYAAEDFSPALKKDLESDIHTLEKIEEMWANVTRDPKLLSFKRLLADNSDLRDRKVIVFTESRETAEYLRKNLGEDSNEVLLFTGSSKKDTQREVIENFDANVHDHKDDYRILIATEVLSEGVNLHRSNVVINYDIPWNPTRLIQRVGRINRVGTKHEKIYIFNFFPTDQANDEIKLKETAESKIHAFISLLGEDAKHLTDEEITESHNLFERLNSKSSLTEEDEEGESELKYLQVIRDIQDKDKKLYEKIERLPKRLEQPRSTLT